jgi:hypothetical protein
MVNLSKVCVKYYLFRDILTSLIRKTLFSTFPPFSTASDIMVYYIYFQSYTILQDTDY